MGYKPKRKVYVLKFEDDEYAGLVIKAGSVSTGKFLDITEAAANAADDPRGMSTTTRGLFTDFAAAVVEWNLEQDDGTPWPVTLASLLAQEFDFVMAIIGAWVDAIGGVTGPLAVTSTGGDPSLEPSIPMEVL